MARDATTSSQKAGHARSAARGLGPAVRDRGEAAVADAAQIAAVFRVLGDASRCRLVYALLRRDEICVGELAARLGMSESNASHHLSVLRAHGLVRFRREGKQVFYAPDDDHIRLLLDMTLEHVRHRADTGDGTGDATGDATGDGSGGAAGDGSIRP